MQLADYIPPPPPGASLPMGDSTSYFTTGGGVGLSAAVGGGVSFNLIPKLNLAAYGTGGYFYSAVSDGSGEGGGNISLKGGLAVSYTLIPSFSLVRDVHYLYNFYLNQGFGLSIGVSYILPVNKVERVKTPGTIRPELLEETTIKRTGKGLEISSIELNKIFPVLFKHYDNSPVGKRQGVYL